MPLVSLFETMTIAPVFSSDVGIVCGSAGEINAGTGGGSINRRGGSEEGAWIASVSIT